MTDLIRLHPPHMPGGFILEFHEHSGGVDVTVWRDSRRDDGFVVRCTDWENAGRTADTFRQITAEIVEARRARA